MFCNVKYTMTDQNQNNIISKMATRGKFSRVRDLYVYTKKLICYTQHG